MTQVDRTPITMDDLEFEGGKLVKVRGVRYNYMDGDSLIFLVSQLGQMLHKAQQTIKQERQTARERFFFPIVMPLNARGQGPASVERGVARKLTWEVWDQFGGSHGSFDYLPDAIDRADELNRKYGRCYDEGCEHFGTPHAHPEKMEPETKG